MKHTKWLGQLFVISLIISLSACSDPKGFKPLAAAEITTLGNNCKNIYGSQIDAWASKDPESLRQIYTDDIVHFSGEPMYVGIDEVVDMATWMLRDKFWQMKAGETYISKNQCFGTWINWGSMNFKEDDPGLEYDLLDTRDNKISYWRLFYDTYFFGTNHMEPIENMNRFGSYWSQNDTAKLSEIYSDDAQLDDTLFGISISGHEEIADYADKFFPGAAWQLDNAFLDDLVDGGVFAITVIDKDGNPCEIRAIVLLTPDESGKIQKQEIFYNADSLLACGWAK